MSVGFEGDALGLQQHALAAPAGCRAPSLVDHPMTRQALSTGRIAQRTAHHTGMTGPPCQCRNDTVGRHPSARDLRYDIEHIIAEGSCLLGRHLIGIVFHLFINGFADAKIIKNNGCTGKNTGSDHYYSLNLLKKVNRREE